MLYEILKEGLIKTDVVAANRDEAIAEVGKLMVDHGSIEPSYIKAMCEVASDLEGYIVIIKGVAMPHARPEKGVNKICSAIILLRNPVEFGNEKNDPVKLVIALAAIDGSSHMSLLKDIATVFGEDETVEQLKAAKNSDEILRIIKKASEEADE
jgi:mannitol/fructose-specific phosphotransferase system IIA component (Ntr-type)